MDEIVAGLARPISVEELVAILHRYLPRIHEAAEKGGVLRKRVLDGETKTTRLRVMISQHVPVSVTEADLEDAEARLEVLKVALREEDAWQCVGIGMSLAQALGKALAQCSKEDGWKPPQHSVLRLVMPGLCNLAVQLDQNAD